MDSWHHLPRTVELDCLIDLVWDAWLGVLSPEHARVSSAELQIATGKLAAWVNGESSPLAIHTLRVVLRLPWSEPKRIAMQSLASAGQELDEIARILLEDPSWMVRRDAVLALGSLGNNESTRRQRFFLACDDPHWRVRLAAVDQAVAWSQVSSWDRVLKVARQIWEPLRATNATRIRRLAGVWRHLHALAEISAVPELFDDSPATSETAEDSQLEDPDPLVLAWNIRSHRREVNAELDLLAARWLGHPNEDVAKAARGRLELCDTPEPLVAALRWVTDPRERGHARLGEFVRFVDGDRLQWMVDAALKHNDPSIVAWGLNHTSSTEAIGPLASELPRWAASSDESLSQAAARWMATHLHIETWLPIIDPLPPLAIATLMDSPQATNLPVSEEQARRWMQSSREELRIAMASRSANHGTIAELAVVDANPHVRIALADRLDADHELLEQLRRDTHPVVRARALRESSAKQLCQNPESETSWGVLRSAAYRQRIGLPTRVADTALSAPPIQQQSVILGQTPHDRVVLPDQSPVAPLGLSGHYHLPEKGFRLALEAGIRLMFFEPNYASMIRFFRSLDHDTRHAIQLVTGTFEADPKRIAKDVDRALRLLRRDHIDLFLFFWVRDFTRLGDESIAAMEAAKRQGKIKHFSLSTHDLSLACEAMRRGWSPMMIRHNAAHRRAEQEALPLAARLGVPTILFNNTCYGRLLGSDASPSDQERPTVTADDCYRFSLSQPGASACWTAPATMDQLRQNLTVLDHLALDIDSRQRLIDRGQTVRKMDHQVAQNIRYID